MQLETVSANPPASFTCLALVKKGSGLHREWNLKKPSYCIYEYAKAFDSHEIRWADGSGQELTEENFSDVVLLKDFDETTWDEILGD